MLDGNKTQPSHGRKAPRRLAPLSLAMAALAFAAGCGHLRNDNFPLVRGGGPTAGTATLTITAVPTATPGSAQVASVQGGGPGAVYRWSIQGDGAFFAGNEAHPATAVVAYTMSGSGPLTLACALLDGTGAVVAQAAAKEVQPAPAASDPLALEAPVWATAGAGGLQARVTQPLPGRVYQWTIAGGTFDGPTQTPRGAQVAFTAGDGPGLTLVCTATTQAGDALSSADAEVAIAAVPAAPVIQAPAAATAGTVQVAQVPDQPGTTYRWTISGGAFAGSNPQPVTAVVAFTPAQAGTLTLTCAAVNAAGAASAAATAQVSVTLPNPMGAPILEAPSWVAAGTGGYGAQVAQPQPGLTYHWTITGGTFEGSAQTAAGPAVSFQAGTGRTLTLSCAVNQGGTVLGTATASVAVAAAPEVPEIHAAARATEDTAQFAWVQGRGDETYRWSITGGAFAGPDPSPAGQVVAFTAGAAGQVQLYCRAVNAAGTQSDPAFFEQQVSAPAGQPAITAPAWVFAGAGGLQAQVTGALASLTYAWTLQGGTFQNGASTAQGPAVTFTAGVGPGLTLTCTATSAAGSVSAPASLGLAVGTAPLAPVIHAPATVPAGSQQVAWVQERPGETYLWTVQGGTFTSPATGASVAYTAGPAGTLILTCAASGGPLTEIATPFNQAVVAAAGAPALQADPWVSAGASATASVQNADAAAVYAWTVQGGTFQGGGATALGPSVIYTAGAGPTLLLTCTAAGPGGLVLVPGAAGVGVAELPPAPQVSAPAFFTVGAGPVQAQVLAPLPGMTYVWTVTGGTFQDGATQAAGTTVTLNNGAAAVLNLTCAARNQAGTVSGQGAATTTGVAASALPALVLPRFWTAGSGHLQATLNAPVQPGTTIQWQVQGGHFSDGTTLFTGPAATLMDAAPGAMLLLCRAVNAAGTPSAAVQGLVDVVAAPAIQSLVDTTGHVLYPNEQALVTATFTGGDGRVNQGVGPVASGQGFLTGAAPAGAFSLTLTVTNAAGTSLAQTLALPVQTLTTTINTFSSRPGPVVPAGLPLQLAWKLTGNPAELTLDLLGDTSGLYPISVLGRTGTQILPKGRQTYVLTSRDPLGTATAQTSVAALGLDLLAGDAVDGSTAYRNGPYDVAAWRFVTGVATDAAGNVWFSEGNDHTVRRIGVDAQVSSLAGLRGNPDSALFPAAVGRFRNPAGLALTPAGTLLVADTDTETLKAVAADGTVTVLAGELRVPGEDDDAPGHRGHLTSPLAVAVHAGTGIAFVAEPGANHVRMVTPDGGLSTLATPPMVPAGLAVDRAGTVYVSDLNSNRVMQLTPTLPLGPASTWTTAFLTVRFNAPRGLALGVDPGDNSEYLLLADTGNHVIRRIALPGGGNTVFAGTEGDPGEADGPRAQARFRSPSAVAIAGDGHVFVADQAQTALRMIAPGGTVTTLGGGNNGLASGGSADGQGAQARFTQPQGLVMDAAGNTFVADTLNHTIRKISPQGQVTTLAGAAGVSGATDGAAGARFNFPTGLALDAAGNLYVSEPAANRIRRITPDGVVATWVNGGLNLPAGLAALANGTLFVADFGSDRILQVAPDGTLQPTAVAEGLGTSALSLDGEGNLYALDAAQRIFYRITPPALPGDGWFPAILLANFALGARDRSPQGSAEFNDPQGLAADSAGNLYVADRGNGLIRRITPDGVVSTVAGAYPLLGLRPGPLPGVLPPPAGLAVTPAGDLAITAGNAVFLMTAP